MMKSTIMLRKFIETVKSGKTALIYGPDYVVLDRKSYDELVTKSKTTDFIIVDDLG